MDKKPNIILITIDCLRADYCGWLNPEREELTPFLNKLAKESMVFTNAYATGPVTQFAFPGILTGTYPFSFTKWDQKYFPGINQRPYLPKILKEKDYFTIAVNYNPYLSPFFGYSSGFDFFNNNLHISYLNRTKGINIFKKIKEGSFKISVKVFIRKNLKIKKIFLRVKKLKGYRLMHYFFKRNKKIYNFLLSIFFKIINIENKKFLRYISSSEKINESALEKIKSCTYPYFLWVHYMATHEPYLDRESTVLKNDVKKTNRALLEKKPVLADEEILKNIQNLYCQNIKYTDQQIEKLFHSLEINNSIIVITADHGQLLGEHNIIGHPYYKLCRELLLVPLIIKTPDNKNSEINKIVSCSQIPATILKLIGEKPASEMQPSLLEKRGGKVYSETLLDFDPLLDFFDLHTKQEIIWN